MSALIKKQFIVGASLASITIHCNQEDRKRCYSSIIKFQKEVLPVTTKKSPLRVELLHFRGSRQRG
jgi:hypothetical protein